MRLPIFFLGLSISLFSHPKVRGLIMSRLINEGLVTPRMVPEKKVEFIKHAGVNLSFLLLGILLIIISIAVDSL